MAQFTVYKYGDLNAPVLNGTNGSVLNVLDYCLVTGSKWTKPFPNSASIGCYKQPSGSQCTLFIHDASPNGTAGAKEAWATGWELLTTMSAPCGTGSGQFPTPSQLLTSGHFVIRKSNTADSVARPWVMYADAYTFYFFYQAGDTAGIYFSTFFGDIYSLNSTVDTYRCQLSGRVIENTANGTTQDQNDVMAYGLATGGAQTGTSGVMPRTAGGRGPAVWIVKMGDWAKSSAANVGANFVALSGIVPCPNPTDNSVLMCPLSIWEVAGYSGGIRGRMRGLYHVPHPLANFSDGQIFNGANEYSGKQFQIVKTGPNSGFWAVEISNTLETN